MAERSNGYHRPPPRNDLPRVKGDLERYNLADLWQDHWGRFKGSRKRIAEAGKLRRGEIRPHVPADIEQADAFRVTIPHGTLMIQNIIQYGTRKQPGIRRPSGPGPQATRLADKIEHWIGSPGQGRCAERATQQRRGAVGELLGARRQRRRVRPARAAGAGPLVAPVAVCRGRSGLP